MSESDAEPKHGTSSSKPLQATGSEPESQNRPTPPSAPNEGKDGSSGLGNLKNRQLGDFRLLRRIGRGGMAEVYLADQVSLNRRVAVKVLRPEMLSDEVHVKRFEQEAIAAAGLNHPNIVQVYSIGEDDGIHFIAQEYVRGKNLYEQLNRQGPPKLSRALHIMKQVAEALQAAGDAGIVHRDIKPENIMITERNEVKVADFGLAQLALGGEGVNLTQVGMTMGTPTYMSPEQVRGQKLDPRSDIYSFGVTCYHMLGGRPPFRGETALSVAVQHLNDTPQPLSERRPDLPPALCRLVHKMMSKELEARYLDTRALLGDILRITQALKEDSEGANTLDISDSDLGSKNDGGRPKFAIPSFDRFLNWSPKQHLIALAIAGIAVASLFAVIGWLLRPGSPLE